MAAPTIRGVGAVASDIAAVTPAYPASTAAGDLVIMFVESANSGVAATATDWTQLTNADLGLGLTTNTVLTVLYRTVSNPGTDNRTTNDTGNHQQAVIVGITAGTWNTSNPFNVTNSGTSGATLSIPGATTTVNDCLILAAQGAAGPDTDTTTEYSAVTNASLTSLTEQVDNTTGQGNGGGLLVVSGIKATAGTVSATTATAVTTANRAYGFLAIEPVSAPTGTIAVTQADQTSSISGSVSPTGTIAVTQAAQTSAIAALETFLGTIAVTQADQTSAIAALETFTGTIAVTQAAQTSDISGTVGAAGVTGTIAVTQNDQTSAISGLETITGTIAITQADQTSAISGTVLNPITGTIAVTQADQTAAFAGTHTINITGTIAVTQDNQTAAFAGVVVNPITGTISVTQADQVMSAAGLLIISGSVAVAQQDQTFTASGLVANPVTGTVAVIQTNQFAGIFGFVGAITFWQKNPIAYTKNQPGFTRVGADDDPPW